MPAGYAVEVLPAARRGLARLPRDAQERIARILRNLALEPRPPGTRLLRGRDRAHRFRIGQYRIVYEINDRDRIVTVRLVGHRRDVYRGL